MRKEIKQRALRRLRILEGQVRGLQKMVQDDKYCLDIINQSLAIKQALSGVEDVVLENHLSTHVLEQVKSGQKGRTLKEYLAIYKLSRKK
ncbi:MAG: metal-sensing transcriptional repressor [Candidatus Doudnabacteria bacterium]|nr:metal-sensing transcriptional repressor [Candidatus Doudnabacteria bacterium]